MSEVNTQPIIKPEVEFNLGFLARIRERVGFRTSVAILSGPVALTGAGCASDDIREQMEAAEKNGAQEQVVSSPDPYQAPEVESEENDSDFDDLAPEGFSSWLERDTVPDPDCAPDKDNPSIEGERKEDGSLSITVKARNANEVLDHGELTATALTRFGDIDSSFRLAPVDESGIATITIPAEEAESYREIGLVVTEPGRTAQEIIQNMPKLGEQGNFGVDEEGTIHNIDQYLTVFFPDSGAGAIIKTDIVKLCSVYNGAEEEIANRADYDRINNPRDYRAD